MRTSKIFMILSAAMSSLQNIPASMKRLHSADCIELDRLKVVSVSSQESISNTFFKMKCALEEGPRKHQKSYLRLRGGNESQDVLPFEKKDEFLIAVMPSHSVECGDIEVERGSGLLNQQSGHGLPLDMHAIIQMVKADECLRFQAGEFHFDETVEIDRPMSFSYAKPSTVKDIQAVREAVAAATRNVTDHVAAATVVRIWGHWSFLNATHGNVTNITTVATAREANYPTLDILGGPWSFKFCGLRSVGGTAILVYASGHAAIVHCCVGSLAGFAKAAYGVTATDSSVVSMRESIVQRCRHAGARFVRQARGEVTDCVFEKCILQGTRNARCKTRTGEQAHLQTSPPEPDMEQSQKVALLPYAP